jgi:hypothetical protein
MRAFTEVGQLIDAQWRDQNYNDDVFPEIAANALSKADLSAHIDPWDPVRWVHRISDLPQQMDLEAKFGDPPITLFVGPRFFIDVNYWLDSTTTIHEHAFCGAFQVLHGGSVHGDYEFEQVHEVNQRFRVGDISLRDVSLLTKGDIRMIPAGSRFIHSLFHLERPSATIVVRTRGNTARQFSYIKPYLALDPFDFEPVRRRKIQTVELLLSSNHQDADQMICDLLDASDFHTTFLILQTAFNHLGSNKLEKLFRVSKSMDRFHAMVDHARYRHGTLANLLPAVFELQQRQNDITARRGVTERADHRLFLGLLLNVPERSKLLELISTRVPGNDAIEQITGWVRELSSIRVFGSPEPNVLGIRGIDDIYLKVLACYLKGWPNDEVKVLLAQECSDKNIDEYITNVIETTIFRSLFSRNYKSARETLASN